MGQPRLEVVEGPGNSVQGSRPERLTDPIEQFVPPPPEGAVPGDTTGQ